MPRAGLSTEHVVAHAGDLVDSLGLDGLSLATLAGRLGVKPPSLYKHVGGLADLHRRLTLTGLHDLREVLRDAAAGVSGRDALLAVSQAYRAYAHRHPGRYAAAQRAPEPGDVEWLAAAEPVVGVLLSALQDYGLRNDAAVHAVRSLRSALHGFVTLEAAGGFGLPQDLEASFAALLDLLDHGLRAA